MYYLLTEHLYGLRESHSDDHCRIWTKAEIKERSYIIAKKGTIFSDQDVSNPEYVSDCLFELMRSKAGGIVYGETGISKDTFADYLQEIPDTFAETIITNPKVRFKDIPDSNLTLGELYESYLQRYGFCSTRKAFKLNKKYTIMYEFEFMHKQYVVLARGLNYWSIPLSEVERCKCNEN